VPTTKPLQFEHRDNGLWVADLDQAGSYQITKRTVIKQGVFYDVVFTLGARQSPLAAHKDLDRAMEAAATHAQFREAALAERDRLNAVSVTVEPARMGARVRDADGHIWKRGRTIWVCQAHVGTHFIQVRVDDDGMVTRRSATITHTGRLHWGALLRESGPLEAIE